MDDYGGFFLSDAQLRYEIEKCESCEEKPCLGACPAGVSPMDFLLAAKVGLPSDYTRAAARIMTANPLGGVCGITCPDTLCMAACVYRRMNSPVNIPACQAAIIQRAKSLGVMPSLEPRPEGRERIAVVGAGPAGLGAAAALAGLGYSVTVFEKKSRPGGMCRYIPESRLPRDILDSDIAWLLSTGGIRLVTDQVVADPGRLVAEGFRAVIVCAGLEAPMALGVDNEDLAVPGLRYLEDPSRFPMEGAVAVVGGGASALDCAVTARERGARRVEIFALETLSEMPLTARERQAMLDYDVEVAGRTRVTEILAGDGGISGIRTVNVSLAEGSKFDLAAISDIRGTDCTRCDIRHAIVAIGARPGIKIVESSPLFVAGDLENGPATVVEAVASGKNAAERVHAYLEGKPSPSAESPMRNVSVIKGWDARPVSLETDFFGRNISSPFLLSAAPPTDGLDQMKAAYDAGWPGGVMKTAFDGVAIHIPRAYMHLFDKYTYGNCDNVSGHALDRVRKEIETLVKTYPDRLTLASTGGSVTGNDEQDRKSWQANTRKLESAGVMGIEYSLSCPQGGDGSEGDIVSQNAGLTAKIVDWIMEVSEPDVPKLFKLTGAVTSIVPIMEAIKRVLARYPKKKAGVTLANTFPVMMFRKGDKRTWEEGIVVGMSGAGVLPISYLTIAHAVASGVVISGNGGPMDYKAAADFLALGARTVQFCTLVMKYGYGVIDHIEEGVSHLMLERGITSMDELVARALPDAITDFMDLPAEKHISAVDKDLCLSCGNCARCPYMAIALDEEKHPVTDASKCIGCGICALKCFCGALYLRERTAEEAAALKET